MDINIEGSGEVVICFIDRTGKTLLQESLRSSGPNTVAARRPVHLFVHTHTGRVAVSPVLVSRSGTQHVTFDNDEPAEFTRRRCREIGCTDAVIEEARHGRVQLLRANPAQKARLPGSAVT